MDFIDLCIKAFKFFGYVFLIVFAIAIVPYLLLIAVAVVFFMAVIGGCVVVVGTILSCFTGKDYKVEDILRSLKELSMKIWTMVYSAISRFLNI